MMFGGGQSRLLNQDTSKARSVRGTLARLGGYFGRFWPMVVAAVLFVVVATWTQVPSPQLIGAATDCFRVRLGSRSARGLSFPGASSLAQTSESACWLVKGPSTLRGTERIISTAYHFGGFVSPALASMTADQRMAGLVRLILIIIALFVLGAVMTGMTFFAMSWSGQHVLRAMRVDVFDRLHQLSMSFYAENEAGDLMSRITNDTSAIEQAISFALVNVFSGILLLVWVAYNMFSSSVPFALLSLAVAPLMFAATLYFSGQARRAFRTSRKEIGNVNAE